MESLDYLELGLLLLAFLGGMLLIRRVDEGPIFWLWAWIALVAVGALSSPGDPSLQELTLAGALAVVFPTFQLAGAYRYAGRAVPAWLLPLGFGLAVLRSGLVVVELHTASRVLSLPFEVAAYLAAAVIVWRSEVAGAGVHRFISAGFIALIFIEVDGRWSRPVAFPQRMSSSTRACARCRASRKPSCLAGVLVANSW